MAICYDGMVLHIYILAYEEQVSTTHNTSIYIDDGFVVSIFPKKKDEGDCEKGNFIPNASIKLSYHLFLFSSSLPFYFMCPACMAQPNVHCVSYLYSSIRIHYMLAHIWLLCMSGNSTKNLYALSSHLINRDENKKKGGKGTQAPIYIYIVSHLHNGIVFNACWNVQNSYKFPCEFVICHM